MSPSVPSGSRCTTQSEARHGRFARSYAVPDQGTVVVKGVHVAAAVAKDRWPREEGNVVGIALQGARAQLRAAKSNRQEAAGRKGSSCECACARQVCGRAGIWMCCARATVGRLAGGRGGRGHRSRRVSHSYRAGSCAPSGTSRSAPQTGCMRTHSARAGRGGDGAATSEVGPHTQCHSGQPEERTRLPDAHACARGAGL